MHVYLPPGYESSRDKLPVLYLQHGGGDNDASWVTVGRANFILDNLLAEKKIKAHAGRYGDGTSGSGFFMQPGLDSDPFYRQLLNEIIPYIETHYRVSVKRRPGIRRFVDGWYSGAEPGLFAPEKFGQCCHSVPVIFQTS